MAKPFPLQVLLDHARHRMDAAERLLRMLKRKEEMARQRLTELEGYRDEYRRRLAGGPGMPIHLLRDFHIFLAKLDEAIRLQEREVAQARAGWEGAHATWVELRQKVKAYEVLASRHHGAEIRREEKRDQRVTDEIAARKRQEHDGLS
jgi:flagellar FliJ protein